MGRPILPQPRRLSGVFVGPLREYVPVPLSKQVHEGFEYCLPFLAESRYGFKRAWGVSSSGRLLSSRVRQLVSLPVIYIPLLDGLRLRAVCLCFGDLRPPILRD